MFRICLERGERLDRTSTRGRFRRIKEQRCVNRFIEKEVGIQKVGEQGQIVTPPTRVHLSRIWLMISADVLSEKKMMDQTLQKNKRTPQKRTLREESFPIPLKYMDVVRHTQTNLDIQQEHNIDNYWNVDSERPLSGSWFGSTRCTVLKNTPPEGHMWAGDRLTRIQTTSRPDEICPEIWSNMYQREARRQWDAEKSKLDAARRSREICYNDSDDEAFDNIIKKYKKKIGNAYGIRHAVYSAKRL